MNKETKHPTEPGTGELEGMKDLTTTEGLASLKLDEDICMHNTYRLKDGTILHELVPWEFDGPKKYYIDAQQNVRMVIGRDPTGRDMYDTFPLPFVVWLEGRNPKEAAGKVAEELPKAAAAAVAEFQEQVSKAREEQNKHRPEIVTAAANALQNLPPLLPSKGRTRTRHN
jgi:hypothetical protein